MKVTVERGIRTFTQIEPVDPMEPLEQSYPYQLIGDLRQLDVDVRVTDGTTAAFRQFEVTVLSSIDPEGNLGTKVLALVTVRHGSLGYRLKGNRVLPALSGMARILTFGLDES
jgi:hypothetical protein